MDQEDEPGDLVMFRSIERVSQRDQRVNDDMVNDALHPPTLRSRLVIHAQNSYDDLPDLRFSAARSAL